MIDILSPTFSHATESTKKLISSLSYTEKAKFLEVGKPQIDIPKQCLLLSLSDINLKNAHQ